MDAELDMETAWTSTGDRGRGAPAQRVLPTAVCGPWPWHARSWFREARSVGVWESHSVSWEAATGALGSGARDPGGLCPSRNHGSDVGEEEIEG